MDRLAHRHATTPTELSSNRASLIDQNRELRLHLHRQDDLIAELSKNIAGMRNQLDEALMHDGVDTRITEDGIHLAHKETQSQTNAYGREAERLQHLLNEEKRRQESTEAWLKESRELRMGISQMKAALINSRYGTASQGRHGAEETDPIHTMNWVFPFDSSMCGAKVFLSEGNYTVSQTGESCHSVSIGSGPLVCQQWGWYFEITVREVVQGWTGGLGIGMTQTAPEQIKHVPDKAWQIPSTYVAGYRGSAFIGGIERRVPWCSDGVQVGTRVGALITSKGHGDFIVFVDGKPVVRVDKAVSVESEGSERFYPIVEVFAAIRVITLSKFATPPEPPWNVNQKEFWGRYSTTCQYLLHAPLQPLQNVQ